MMMMVFCIRSSSGELPKSKNSFRPPTPIVHDSPVFHVMTGPLNASQTQLPHGEPSPNLSRLTLFLCPPDLTVFRYGYAGAGMLASLTAVELKPEEERLLLVELTDDRSPLDDSC